MLEAGLSCTVRRVSLEQHMQEGATKALAALHYEERCEVQRFSEPASAITFFAQGTPDGVPFPHPGVAVLIVRSNCPSNTSLSVQVVDTDKICPGTSGHSVSSRHIA